MEPITAIELATLPVAFVAAVLSGTAGFGGALLLLPTLSLAFGVERAIPLLGIAQLASNLGRATFGLGDIAWRPVLAYSVGALPMAVLGALAFALAAGSYVGNLVGIAVIALALRGLRAPREAAPGETRPGETTRRLATQGAIVGLVSATAGTAGPLGNLAFLSLGLTPTAYVASEAAATALIHSAKLVVFGQSELLSARDLPYGLMLALIMLAGTRMARAILERLSRDTFERPVRVLMIASGTGMVLDGLV